MSDNQFIKCSLRNLSNINRPQLSHPTLMHQHTIMVITANNTLRIIFCTRIANIKSIYWFSCYFKIKAHIIDKL